MLYELAKKQTLDFRGQAPAEGHVPELLFFQL